MNTDLIRNKIKGMMQGATQVYINYSSIKLISIQLPLLEEQQKIRGFLEVLSGITTKQLHKIDQLKERKRRFTENVYLICRCNIVFIICLFQMFHHHIA